MLIRRDFLRNGTTGTLAALLPLAVEAHADADAICPKSSFALGYARVTEYVTITNCYVTEAYEYGTMLDGTWKPHTYSEVRKAVGRIKCGTESNGGFKNITISNCILDRCRGFALETVDGAHIEDITVTNLSMRGCGPLADLSEAGCSHARAAGSGAGSDASHSSLKHHQLRRGF